MPSLVVLAYDAGAGQASLHVDGARALTLRGESGGDSGRVVAGHSSNSVASGVPGGTIGGGGYDDGSQTHPNIVSGNYGTVGGGRDNEASGAFGTVAGGFSNSAGTEATVAGGSGNEASASNATVAGGKDNMATTDEATVSGGTLNEAGARLSTISGGAGNTTSAAKATVSGGRGNTASGSGASVSGGENNTAGDANATVGGGTENEALAPTATVSGGRNNSVTAQSGMCPGGEENEVTQPLGFAAGRQAKSNHLGSFVWADSTDSTFQSLDPDEFAVQASGGFYFFSNEAANTGVQLAPGSGSWSSASTRKVKSHVDPVDAPTVLDRVQDLAVSTWTYDDEDDDVRHMGPMAEDFHDAFGLGDDPECISNVDADGVALAAIKGLAGRLEAKDDRIEEQAERIDDLESEDETLERRLETLEDRVAKMTEQAPSPPPVDD